MSFLVSCAARKVAQQSAPGRSVAAHNRARANRARAVHAIQTAIQDSKNSWDDERISWIVEFRPRDVLRSFMVRRPDGSSLTI
jgi:hypothetical protein